MPVTLKVAMSFSGLHSYNKYFLTERHLLGSQADAKVKARQFKYRLMMDNFCWYNVKHKDKLRLFPNKGRDLELEKFKRNQ